MTNNTKKKEKFALILIFKHKNTEKRWRILPAINQICQAYSKGKFAWRKVWINHKRIFYFITSTLPNIKDIYVYKVERENFKRKNVEEKMR